MSAASLKPVATQAPPELPVPPTEPQGFRRQQQYYVWTRLLGDIGIGAACFVAVLAARQLLHESVPLTSQTVLTAALFLGIGECALAVMTRGNACPCGASRTAATLGGAALVVYPLLFFDRSFGNSVSRGTALLFELAVILALSAWHAVARRRYVARLQTDPKHVILAGDAAGCGVLARAMGPGSYYRVAATVADSGGTREGASSALAQLQRLLRERPVHEIFLVPALFDSNPNRALFYRGVLELSEQTRTRLHVSVHWLESYDRVQLDHWGQQPLLSFSFAPEDGGLLLVKRWMDVLGAGLGLLLVAPVLAVTALLVLFCDGRPVIFSQIRPGLRGRPFRIYKFRTMVPDAEARQLELESQNEVDAIAFKMTRDPRITRLGSWLRKTSIDELPQLWNVVRGEMSLVGPRPIPCELDRYDLPHLRRLAMKPGITGLWQVRGRSSISSFSEWLELDTSYIRNWSPALDAKILLRTIWAVVRLTGR